MKNNNATQEAARRAVPQLKNTIIDPQTIAVRIVELFGQLEFTGKVEVLKNLKESFIVDCKVQSDKIEQHQAFLKEAYATFH